MDQSLKTLFLLRPDIVFLNHGSFGACPQPVFETYQSWQRELEQQPVEYFMRSSERLAEARQKLAAYVNANASDLVYFPNPTTAMNMAARSLKLEPGDEILTTDQEYPAMDRTWEFITRRAGAHYVHQPIPLPLASRDEFVEALWSGVTKHTKVIFLSHYTCSTSLIFPVAEVCRRAREAGLITIVDGAHAVSQVPLDLTAIGADIYAGACHKWLCAPKGSAFLYARPEAQAWLEPLVISRGWGQPPEGAESAYVYFHEGQGTRDLAAFLSVPSAIEFQAACDWDSQRRRCHELARTTRDRLNALTGLDALCPDSPEWFSQMVSIRLPDLDPPKVSARLREDCRITVPVMKWHDQAMVRVSFQAYNDQADADALIDALAKLLNLGHAA